VTEAIRRIQQAGALDVRIEKRGDQEVTIISFRRKVANDVEKDISFVKDALADLEQRRLLQTNRTVLLAFKRRWKQTGDQPDGKETQ
jgi:hypothetical protein